jgi:hypothetical protein
MLIKETSSSFEQAPIGAHIAICVSLIDIGTSRKEYEGRVSYRREVRIAFELPNELIETGEHAGQPHVVSMFYTMSLSEKAKLRDHLKNWRGRDFTPSELSGFDLRNILGKPCMLSVTHNGKGKSIIGGIMSLPRGTPVPALANNVLYFSLDEFDQSVFDSLSEGIKGMIEKSREYQALIAPPDQNHDAPHDDEIDYSSVPDVIF